MIVTQTNYGWQIIHQQAHGLLAFQAALQWKVKKRPLRWVETLVALTEHDDGQDKWEGRNHLTEIGTPLDFKILEYSVEQCRQMIQIGLEKSRWNALMLSKHTTFLYESMRGKDKQLDTFLDEQQQNQETWQAQYGATQEDVQYAYDFLQWCDALSLILCQGQLPPEGRKLEISVGPDGKSYFIFQRPDESLGVEPWPFEEANFSLHVEAYQVRQLSFKDDAELYDVLNQSDVEQLEWTFRAN